MTPPRTGPTTDHPPVSESEQLLFGGPMRYDYGWARHEFAGAKVTFGTVARQMPRFLRLAGQLAWAADRTALVALVAAEVLRGVGLTAGDVYAYPAGGPRGFPTATFTSSAQEFRHLVDMPLTHGVTYYAHVSTRPPGQGSPNAVNNPAVTGHSVAIR
ncbi:hypothetical protein ACIRD3_03895 [Kitasatospora sp. NPDC093550]|uniref:hypothetical protein n=1 Tax=Kitasatospora sp. NPDC093550 TaxID=3364089 RepID=UPI003815F321